MSSVPEVLLVTSELVGESEADDIGGSDRASCSDSVDGIGAECISGAGSANYIDGASDGTRGAECVESNECTKDVSGATDA